LKVLFLWPLISGYMSACWRALAAEPGVDLFVLAQQPGRKEKAAAFKSDLMNGVPCELLTSDRPVPEYEVRRAMQEHRPDIVVINGWHTPGFVKSPFMPGASRARFIMAMDTPYRGTLRQRFGRYALKAFFDRIDRVFVTGERSWQLARVLGFKERIIRRGVYGIDYDLLSPTHAQRLRQPGGWPRKFLYTGRYAPEKAIDVLVKGYARYRSLVGEPWPLTCCGKGPEAHLLQNAEGVTDRGFVQPADLANVMAEHGAFVLASRFDPWPLVIVESCAAGLPIVCSEACGTRVELVRFPWNGTTFATDDPDALAESLLWIHLNHARLPTMGERSRHMAEPYSAQMWVERWMTTFRELTGQSRGAGG
jgi:glycosyltransferase involved in cell wall biosynthesis